MKQRVSIKQTDLLRKDFIVLHGMCRLVWNISRCVIVNCLFCSFLYKGHHLTRRAQALGGMSPDTQRISIGLVYSIPVFDVPYHIFTPFRLIFHMGEATASPM